MRMQPQEGGGSIEQVYREKIDSPWRARNLWGFFFSSDHGAISTLEWLHFPERAKPLLLVYTGYLIIGSTQIAVNRCGQDGSCDARQSVLI